MPKRFILLWAAPVFVSTGLCAQPQDSSPPADRTLWDHNGSIMYLVASGSSRELHYQKPRPGMLEAGAHPDDVLFKGEINGGQFSGIAYIFNAQCGQVPFHVKGPMLDNGGRIVLTGQAPHVGRNCQTLGEYTSTLEFKLLKTSEVTQQSYSTTPAASDENREQSTNDAAESQVSKDTSAQSARTRQTALIEDPWPNVPPSGTMDPKLRGTLSAETIPTVQPSIERPKPAGDARAVNAPAIQPSLTTSAPTSARSLGGKNVLAPIIIALNATLPLLSILFLILMVRSNEVVFEIDISPSCH
jgi:hypothetical protein